MTYSPTCQEWETYFPQWALVSSFVKQAIIESTQFKKIVDVQFLPQCLVYSMALQMES